jgi:hypothetical protein
MRRNANSALASLAESMLLPSEKDGGGAQLLVLIIACTRSCVGRSLSELRALDVGEASLAGWLAGGRAGDH